MYIVLLWISMYAMTFWFILSYYEPIYTVLWYLQKDVITFRVISVDIIWYKLLLL